MRSEARENDLLLRYRDSPSKSTTRHFTQMGQPRFLGGQENQSQ